MIAKVIAHGATRAEAARRLCAVLRGATLHGPTTNRELLLHLLVDLCAIDGPDGPGLDTGWLDRQELGDGPTPAPAELAAAALAVVHERGARARFPIAWRNNPSQLHAQVVVHGDVEHRVQYAFDRTNLLTSLVVDDQPVALDVAALDALARVPAQVVGSAVYVHRGRFAFEVPPRFVSPDDAGRLGSTVAPMPGRVIALLVEVGDTVVAGQGLLTMEAMKMEHRITSPHAGTVGEIHVRAGQQLDGGQPLLRVDPA
jgi:acetyl/propionyl-CoA carboxylase alpha subunit